MLFNVFNQTTTKCLWDKLENLFEGKHIINMIFLCRQFYSPRMKDGSLLQEHLDEFNTLINRLVSVGVKIEEEEV